MEFAGLISDQHRRGRGVDHTAQSLKYHTLRVRAIAVLLIVRLAKVDLDQIDVFHKYIDITGRVRETVSDIDETM